MRSTFWLNCICERQSCQNRHTGLKSSSKREKSALFMSSFQVMRRRFLPKSYFSGSNFSKSLDLSQILFKTEKQCAFHENCTKRSFQVMRSTFWRNRILKRQSCQNRHTGLEFSPKRGKQCAFHKNCTKRAFQVMRSTFLPKRIFKRQSCQNRHTGLKFSPKRGKSALFMKIVQNARFRSYAAGFGQIAFVSVKVVKFVTLAWKARQNGKRVRFSWKLYKTLVSGHAQHVLAKLHFWESKLSKSSHWPEKLVKTEKGALFMKIVQNARFRSCAARFGQIVFFRVKLLKIVRLVSNSLQKRKNSALFMKIVQNALFRSCAARFGRIAFLSVKVVKIVTLAWNSLQNGKTVRFP